jgi:thiol-disulfide isomerase/thioredoxin
MLLLLVAAALSVEQTVLQLTAATFRRRVQGRKPHEVWLVMFAGTNCPACQEVRPRFVNASNIASGMIRFGLIDTQRSPEVAKEYDVRTIPVFRIFHARGDTEFVGKRKERDFINQAASFIEDLSQPVERSWADSMLARPSVMLFTDKPKTPAIWAGISAYFHGKSIRIGTCKDDPDVAKFFNVSKMPAIIFMNGTGWQVYKDKITFRALKSEIETYFEKRLKDDTEQSGDGDFLTPSEFSAKCLGGRQNCVIYIAAKPHMVLEQLAKRYARYKMKWFVGLHDVPFSFMTPGHVWIYNPRRDGFLHVDDMDELANVIDLMLDGTAKWITREKLTEANGQVDSL